MWVQNLTEDPNEVIRSRPKTPKGFDSREAFLKDMREKYAQGKTYNEQNQNAGREDIRFLFGEQWEDLVKQRRTAQRKPVLVFNRLVAFMAQIVGNRLMNETEIRVWPDSSDRKDAAQLREDLIRSIYKNSDADLARDEAMKYQVICGQGAFCLRIEYASDDVFEQKISVGMISDPYAVTFDPMSVDPTGADAEWATIEEDMPKEMFKSRWPWAAEVSFERDTWDSHGHWCKEDSLRIVAYWRMVTDGFKTLALFKDGTTHDVTDMEEWEYINYVDFRSDGAPYTREVPIRKARMYVCSGKEILEGPFDYPISSIPVYRVSGWEVSDGTRINRWGLIRFLKDPQRLENYWASVQAEQLISAPRNKWLTTPSAVQGHEARWRRSPQSDDPFLFVNEDSPAPVPVPPPAPDAALYTERAKLAQDMKDISNIHEATLGAPSNEVSGKAIQARAMNSDVGSFIYHDRLRLADERCAKNINELVPYIYDTKRMVTVVGRDNEKIVRYINDPEDPNSDVTMGQYGITVTVGPSSVTKRALAAEQMMAFVNAIPGVADKVMDLVAEAQDWPQADEFAKRFRQMMLSSGVIPESEMTEEEQELVAKNSEAAAMQQQIDMANAKAEIAGKEAQANLRMAQASQAEANAYKAQMDADSRRMDVESKNEDRDTKAFLQATDQHNKLEAEDRGFALDREKMENQNFEKDREYLRSLEHREQDRADALAAEQNTPTPRTGRKTRTKKEN